MVTKEELIKLLVKGMRSVLDRDAAVLKESAESFIAVSEQVEQEGFGKIVEEAIADFKAGQRTKGEQTALEDVLETIRLLKIKDPFESWNELSRLIGQDWPEGLTAEEAVRRQRR